MLLQLNLENQGTTSLKKVMHLGTGSKHLNGVLGGISGMESCHVDFHVLCLQIDMNDHTLTSLRVRGQFGLRRTAVGWDCVFVLEQYVFMYRLMIMKSYFLFPTTILDHLIAKRPSRCAVID